MRTAVVLAGWAWLVAALPQFTDAGRRTRAHRHR